MQNMQFSYHPINNEFRNTKKSELTDSKSSVDIQPPPYATVHINFHIFTWSFHSIHYFSQYFNRSRSSIQCSSNRTIRGNNNTIEYRINPLYY